MKTKVADNVQLRKICLFFQKFKTPQYFHQKNRFDVVETVFLMKILRGLKSPNPLIIKIVNPNRHAHWHCLRRKD